MADLYQKPYLDSSGFIAFIRNEVRGRVDRARIITHILAQAEKGQYRIYTSAFTLAEVHKRRGAEPLPGELDTRILSYFEHDYIEIISVDRGVGEAANELARVHGLEVADAIHLACALRAGCDVLLAWDRRLTELQLPNIRTEEPEVQGQSSLDDIR